MVPTPSPARRADPSTDGASALVVVCRRPGPGVGKQRIAAELGEEAAWRISELLLATALEDASTWPGPVVLAPAQAEDADWAARQMTRDCRVIAQGAGNLGRRLAAIDRQLRRAGQRQIIFIGSDAPGLDARYYEQARAALKARDVVLGPALDGGVTLMGSRRGWPDLEPLPWSTGYLARQLERNCIAAGLSIRKLEPRGDVDVAADLPRLLDELARDPRPARRALKEWLTQHRMQD